MRSFIYTWRRLAARLVISASALGSTLRSPLSVLTVTGKNVTYAAIRIRARFSSLKIEYTIGPSAMTGTIWDAIAYGRRLRSSMRDCAISTARPKPTTPPTLKPRTALRSVIKPASHSWPALSGLSSAASTRLGRGSFICTTRISAGTVGSAPVMTPSRNSGETLAVKYTHASNCHTIKRAIATATTGSGSGSLTPTLIFIPVPGLLRASGGGPQPPARRNAAHRASRVRAGERGVYRARLRFDQDEVT